MLPKRPADCNKGDFGRLLIVAGSRGMSGAAVLAARAALKTGAGLVTIATPKSAQPVIAACLPEAITLPLEETKDGAASLKALPALLRHAKTGKPDLLLIGPGMGTDNSTAKLIFAVITKLNIPFVTDADALNCAAAGGWLSKLQKLPPHILTPHPGEISRLLNIPAPRGEKERFTSAKKLAEISGGIAVLKGSGTLVCDGKNCAQNTTGGPALAKAGTGDVLAGMLSGLWLQSGKQNGFKETAFPSAKAAVYLHGLCGDMAAKELGERSVLAGELVYYLPTAIKTL